MTDIITLPNWDGEYYPMMTEYRGENGDQTIHPLLVALNEHDISEVEVGNGWEDDHCECLDLIVTVNGQKYGVSVWWLSREGVRMCYHAEAGKAEALADLKQFLIDSAY